MGNTLSATLEDVRVLDPMQEDALEFLLNETAFSEANSEIVLSKTENDMYYFRVNVNGWTETVCVSGGFNGDFGFVEYEEMVISPLGEVYTESYLRLGESVS